MRKIVMTGPESTGKTTVAEKLAGHFKIPFVREVARDYLHHISRPYQYEDVINICLLQMAEEEKIRSVHPRVLICDTDTLTIKVWCDDKFSKCETWIDTSVFDRLPEMYFLCKPDFKWQHDHLREDPSRQQFLYDVYHAFLSHNKIPFIELQGPVEARMHTVLNYLNQD